MISYLGTWDLLHSTIWLSKTNIINISNNFNTKEKKKENNTLERRAKLIAQLLSQVNFTKDQ